MKGPTEESSFWVIAKVDTTISPTHRVEIRWIDGRSCPVVATALRQLPALTVEPAGGSSQVGMEDPLSTFVSTEGSRDSLSGWKRVEFRVLYYPRSTFGDWFRVFGAATAPCLHAWRPVLP